MTILLVRHTHAGNRSSWNGDDTIRPVSALGRKQAKKLVKVLRDHPIARILSSPYDRCIQSVLPLAEARGVGIEPHPSLAEDASRKQVRKLLRKVSGQDVVLCTHGDVIPVILAHLRDEGVDLGRKPRYDKASTWVIETRKGSFTEATYLPPPKG